MFDFIQKYSAGVYCGQELGKNWSAIPAEQSLQTLARGAIGPSVRAVTAHNYHSGVNSPNQWGGTAVLSMDQMSRYAAGVGRDPTGLGRWCWARFRGKNGIFLRVASIYCPCAPPTSAHGTPSLGELSVYKQHQKFLNECNDDRDPRTAFLEDFETELASWIDEGDQVIVAGDFNFHVLEDPITSLFERYDMHNMVFALHDPQGFPASSGKGDNRTVDAIFGTPNLVPLKAGYIDICDHPGHHYALWADISLQSSLGHPPTQFPHPKMRRLQLSNAKCVAKYQQRLKQLLRKHNLFHRQYALEMAVLESGGAPLTEALAKEAEAIDNIRTQCMLSAEKQCRKFRTGEVEFSPTTAMPARAMRYWFYLIRKRQGYTISATKLTKLRKQADIHEPTAHLSEADLWNHTEQHKPYILRPRNSIGSSD